MENDIQKRLDYIKKTVGDGRATVALSGGVDSAVVTKLALEALDPSQLLVFTIDDGLRRAGEPEWVQRTFQKLDIKVEIIPIPLDFFDVLRGVKDAEWRRKAFSREFGRVSGKIAAKFKAEHVFFGTNALDLQETKHGGQGQHNAWQAMGVNTQDSFGFQPVEPIKL